MEKKYKITNYSNDIVSVYNSKDEHFVLKPRVSVIIDRLPAARVGLLAEEIDKDGNVIKPIDIALEKAKEEMEKWNKENKEQKKLFEHIKKKEVKVI